MSRRNRKPLSLLAAFFASFSAALFAASFCTLIALDTALAQVAPTEDIRDIRGPKGIFPLWLVALLIAGVVLLALGAYALWRWKQRRPADRPLLPFEIALRRLEGTRGLLHPSSVREFSIAISDIVRQYIEEEFKVVATHRTTEEFLRDLLDSSTTALAAHRNLLTEFLRQCDIAKFAGVTLSTQIMETLYQSARTFIIESSKPPAANPTPEDPHSIRVLEAHDSLPST
jgi:hypothetical protein